MRTRLPDIKISSYDKFQALRRRPVYRADYWEFMLWCRENDIDETDYLDHPEAAKKAEELCQKYGITYLFNPSVNIPKHWESGFFIEEREMVEVLYPTEYRDLNEEEINKGYRPQFLPIPIFENREELILKIDLKFDKNDIMNKIERQIDYHRYFVSKRNSRMTSEREIDKWKVWDIYNKTKSFKKTAEKLNAMIAKRLKLLNANDVKEEAPQPVIVSTVRKAYYRAVKLVYGEKYDPKNHKPEKLPLKLRYRTCNQCPEKSTCQELCPDVLPYVMQDEKSGDYIPPVSVDEYIRRKDCSNSDEDFDDGPSDFGFLNLLFSVPPEKE